LPQFLFEGKPILLTDPEQVARWDQLARQESEEKAPGRMAQLFKVQRWPAPWNISRELEKSSEGKIVFQSADRPGWDKVIYYHAGEKRAAERLAEILRNSRELTEQQQAEVWRLEGWPEADIARELERIRNVQRMQDDSWWTPAPSLMDRARQRTKSLLSFRQAKKAARPVAKAEPEQAQRLLREIERSPELVAKLPQSAPFAELPKSAPFVELPRSAPFNVAGRAEAGNFFSQPEIPLRRSAPAPSKNTGSHQAGVHTAVRTDLDRTLANGEVKVPAGLSPKDEPILRWLDAAMEDVHRYGQDQRRSLKAKP